MKIQKVCVLGGTGFVGGHLVTHLCNQGYALRVLTRNRARHRFLLVMPKVELIQVEDLGAATLAAQLRGCDAVINLIGILNGAEQEFNAVHAELPQRLVEACRESHVRRYLHMSALNADAENGVSLYLRSKGLGEDAAHRGAAFGIEVTSFRPSVIFGPDDSLFNRFAGLLKFSWILPLARAGARFAPVYVGDVVAAFAAALGNPATAGQRYELCGPRVYTLKELAQYSARLIGRRRWVIGLPDGLAKVQARLFERLPGQLFTMDNFRSLQLDNVCKSDGLAALDIVPKSVEGIMAQGFSGSAARARYGAYRKMVRR
ncbi:MAG: complex I NDUFA9 subunit family protein [Gammaproteobacteria bacterium]